MSKDVGKDPTPPSKVEMETDYFKALLEYVLPLQIDSVNKNATDYYVKGAEMISKALEETFITFLDEILDGSGSRLNQEYLKALETAIHLNGISLDGSKIFKIKDEGKITETVNPEGGKSIRNKTKRHSISMKKHSKRIKKGGNTDENTREGKFALPGFDGIINIYIDSISTELNKMIENCVNEHLTEIFNDKSIIDKEEHLTSLINKIGANDNNVDWQQIAIAIEEKSKTEDTFILRGLE